MSTTVYSTAKQATKAPNRLTTLDIRGTTRFQARASNGGRQRGKMRQSAMRKETTTTYRGTELSYSIPEINFRRLLQKCEDMARSEELDGWRFEKYIEALDQLFALLKSPEKPDDLVLNGISSYEQRIQMLKKAARPGLYHSESDTRRSLFHEQNNPGHGSVENDLEILDSHAIETAKGTTAQVGDIVSVEERPSSISTPSLDPSLLLRNDANRKELLESPGRINKDMDVVVSAEIGRQEKITEEMLHLTRSLKENMSTANQLVKRDFKVLDKANSLADRNTTRLDKESVKLAQHNQNSTGWWTLLALICLFAVFIFMVLFIKMFAKPRRK